MKTISIVSKAFFCDYKEAARNQVGNNMMHCHMQVIMVWAMNKEKAIVYCRERNKEERMLAKMKFRKYPLYTYFITELTDLTE